MDQFCLYTIGDRAHTVLGAVVSETKTQLEFRTLNNDMILLRAIRGELDQFNDQGLPAEVEVFRNEEFVSKGHYLPLAPGLFLVVGK